MYDHTFYLTRVKLDSLPSAYIQCNMCLVLVTFEIRKNAAKLFLTLDITGAIIYSVWCSRNHANLVTLLREVASGWLLGSFCLLVLGTPAALLAGLLDRFANT